jgi:hypothetical protein
MPNMRGFLPVLRVSDPTEQVSFDLFDALVPDSGSFQDGELSIRVGIFEASPDEIGCTREGTHTYQPQEIEEHGQQGQEFVRGPMARRPVVMMRLKHFSSGLIALFSIAGLSTLASAESNFPTVVNYYCTQEGRIPAEPIASDFPTSCQSCHQPGTFNKGSVVQPAFGEMQAGLETDDYSYFCQLIANTNTPPGFVTIPSDPSIAEGELLSFRITATDADMDSLTLSASDLPPGADFFDNGDGTGDFDWTPDFGQDGNYPVTFTVVDDSLEMGSASSQLTISVGNVNRPPSLAPIGAQVVGEGELLVFTVSASDPDLDALTLSGADLPTGATFTDNDDGTGEFRWTPTYDQAANFTVTLMVTDAGSPAESDAQTFTISVGDVNRPPVLATIGNRSTDMGVQLNIPMTAADPDGDAVSLSAANLPEGARFDEMGVGTAEFIWTPSADQTGNHAVTFTATDLGSPTAVDSEEITITVGVVNRPPELGAIGNRMVDAGSALDIIVTASDPDGDALTFAADVPDGATFVDLGDGTAEFSWTPTSNQVGHHSVRYTVVDDGSPPEQNTQEIMISVGEINRPPALAPIGDRKAPAEESLAIVITANDPDGDPLVFESDGVPDGARFTDFGDGTAELTWVPRLDQLGRHDVTVTVSESVAPGVSDIETFAIHVDSKLAELPTVDLEARWRCGRSRLEVKARDLPVRTMVRFVDARTGALLGKRISNRRGKVHFRRRLHRAPSSVQIEWDVNGVLVQTASVLVEGPDDRCNRRVESHNGRDDYRVEIESHDGRDDYRVEIESHDGRDDYRIEMMRLLKKWMERFR